MSEPGSSTVPQPGPPAVAPDPAVDEVTPPPPPPLAQDRLAEPLRDPTPLDRRWVAGAVAGAVAADLTLRQMPLTNVAGTILIAVLAVALVASGFLVTRTSRLLAAGAVVFGAFLAIRTQPILLAFDLLAAASLLVLAAIHGRTRSLWELRPLQLVYDAGVVVEESVSGLFEVPAEAAARWRVARERASRGDSELTWAVLRGLAITAPVLLVLGGLLASADVVFQSFFESFGLLDVPSLIGHLVLLAFGAYGVMVLLRLGHREGADPAPRSDRQLGPVETGVLLVSVNLLFATFAVAQLLTVVGGADAALERAGLDPKQFARQGFFQLLWVAGLTLTLLMVVHALTAEQVAARRVNRLLAPVTVALTLLIVGVAFTRILFYVGDGGLTPLRLYSAVFALWVGLAFVVTAVRIRGFRASRAWLLPVLIVSGLVTLAGLNLADPERLIARTNLDRTDEVLYWHVVAGQFSPEGEAVLADGLDDLDPDLAARIAEQLCTGHDRRQPSDGWMSFNLGQRRGQQALDRLCG